MSSNQPKESDSLKMVLIIFQHGYRKLFGDPDDPNEAFMKHELTKEGRQQMYKLGEHLHRRYDKLINFNPRSIYARSSARNRCLESSGCFLASFCPPKDYYDRNPALNWQPIRINSMPVETDHDLFPKNSKGVASCFFTVTIKNELQEGVKRVEFATSDSSENKINFFYLVEGLVCQVDHNLSVDPKVQNNLQDVLDRLDLYYEESISRTVGEGGLFDDIYKLLQTFITVDGKLKDGPIKCYAYCTSDMNIIVLLEILGLCKGKIMPYGSTLLLEIHEIDGAPRLKLLFNRNISKDYDKFKELQLKNCGRYCTIQDYKEAGKSYSDSNKPGVV